MEHYEKCILAISSASLSIGHFIIAAETRNVVAWVVGLTVGAYSLYTSYTTSKAQKAVERANEAIKRKTDLEIEALNSKNKG
jgi:hypothetical protein